MEKAVSIKRPQKDAGIHRVYGVFDSTGVNDFVKSYFKDTKKDENFRKSKICYASLKLDIDGNYITDSFGISTLPWALGRLEKNQIKNDDWSKGFEAVKGELAEFIEQVFITAANRIVACRTSGN